MQGSILGQLLFILYLNDLPSSISHIRLLSFADDTKCFKSIQNDADVHALQEDLDHIRDWSGDWKITFNISIITVSLRSVSY